MTRTADVFRPNKPCSVVVHRGRTTTRSAASAALYLGIPVVHVDVDLPNLGL